MRILIWKTFVSLSSKISALPNFVCFQIKKIMELVNGLFFFQNSFTTGTIVVKYKEVSHFDYELSNYT